jgi:transposase
MSELKSFATGSSQRHVRHAPKAEYRACHRVEQFFDAIKPCRRIATRYDKLAANDLAF